MKHIAVHGAQMISSVHKALSCLQLEHSDNFSYAKKRPDIGLAKCMCGSMLQPANLNMTAFLATFMVLLPPNLLSSFKPQFLVFQSRAWRCFGDLCVSLCEGPFNTVGASPSPNELACQAFTLTNCILLLCLEFFVQCHNPFAHFHAVMCDSISHGRILFSVPANSVLSTQPHNCQAVTGAVS